LSTMVKVWQRPIVVSGMLVSCQWRIEGTSSPFEPRGCEQEASGEARPEKPVLRGKMERAVEADSRATRAATGTSNPRVDVLEARWYFKVALVSGLLLVVFLI